MITSLFITTNGRLGLAKGRVVLRFMMMNLFWLDSESVEDRYHVWYFGYCWISIIIFIKGCCSKSYRSESLVAEWGNGMIDAGWDFDTGVATGFFDGVAWKVVRAIRFCFTEYDADCFFVGRGF